MKQFYPLIVSMLTASTLAITTPVFSQCSLPGGSILITQASFGNLTTVGSGAVYYVAPGTTTSIDHTAGNLTVSGGGKIFVMANATLIIQMGGKNMTINGGIVQLCSSSHFNISPGHDFTFQGGSSLIQLGINAHINMCNFGHDITFNAGSIQMDDQSSIEFGDFHNIVSNAANLVTYTGLGTVSTAHGNPIFHIGGTDFVHNTNTSNIGSPLTSGPHIDFVNDALGSDNPGTATYCGPKTSPTYSTCRPQWGGMAVNCGAADIFQTYLPVLLTDFRYSIQSGFVNLYWNMEDQANLDHFELERSTTDGIYEFVASVPVKLNSELMNNYSYHDSKPFLTDTKYRLKMIGKDEKSNYSNVLLIHADQTTTVVSCYPNPITDHLNLSTNFIKTTPVTIELCNISGMRLKSLHLTIPAGRSLSTINDLSGLPTGTYLMKISTDEKNYYQEVYKK